MTPPKQFKKENSEKILIYHYVEELVNDFGEYTRQNFSDKDVTDVELPLLLRIRCADISTQKDLVNLFHLSDGYASKILRKFEEKELITRYEDPSNRRRKIVKLTDKGIQKTDKILEHITKWENQHMTSEELLTLKKLLFKFMNEN